MILPKIDNIVNLYMYGSRVYNTHSEKSDYDFIAVVEGVVGKKDQYEDENCNVTIYDLKSFQETIDEHEISVLECLFLPQDKIIVKSMDFDFNLNLSKLRSSFSHKSSNSWSKARKKLTVEKDFNEYIAKKSLFHSLRIFKFGIQLAKYEKIIDFEEANEFWKTINEIDSNTWNDYKQEFQVVYNSLKSDFKIVAPLT